MRLARCWLVFVVMVLSASGAWAADAPTKVLLVGKPPDHPPGTHEYLFECRLLAKCLEQTEGVTAIVSDGWPQDPKVLEDVDVLVLYTAMGGNLLSSDGVREQAEALLNEGVGMVMIHWSTGADEGRAGQWQLDHLGGWFGFAFSKIPVRDSRVRQLAKDHPICRGWSDFDMRDEYYTHLRFHENARPLIGATIDGEDHVVGWALERPGAKEGRSFGFVCGHFHDCFALEPFRKAVTNAILWAGHREVPEEGAPCELTPRDLELPPDPREKP
jgi:type 1 glutamine amidotransferase